MSFVSFVLSSEKEQDFVCHGIFIYVWKFGSLLARISFPFEECQDLGMASLLDLFSLDSMHL